MLAILKDLKERAELLKSLFESRSWWELADAALDAAKKVKSLWDEVDGLFFAVNPVELEKAEAELTAVLAELEAAKADFKPVFGADSDPKAIDPVTVITLVTLVLELIKKWRDNRKK